MTINSYDTYLAEQIKKFVKAYHDECDEDEYMNFVPEHLEEFLFNHGEDFNLFENYVVSTNPTDFNVFQFHVDEDGCCAVDMRTLSRIVENVCEHAPDYVQILTLPDCLSLKAWTREDLIDIRNSIDNILKEN